MRAAFKAVDGRQAGGGARADDRPRVPAPEDASASGSPAFPVTIEMVSRFRTKPSRRRSQGRRRRQGRHHRRHAPLLSKDVQFRDLGLLVIDEEQRFGVAHKERLKQLRQKVDVLTMTRRRFRAR